MRVYMCKSVFVTIFWEAHKMADDIYWMKSFARWSILYLLKFVPNGPINNKTSIVYMMIRDNDRDARVLFVQHPRFETPFTTLMWRHYDMKTSHNRQFRGKVFLITPILSGANDLIRGFMGKGLRRKRAMCFGSFQALINGALNEPHRSVLFFMYHLVS